MSAFQSNAFHTAAFYADAGPPPSVDGTVSVTLTVATAAMTAHQQIGSMSASLPAATGTSTMVDKGTMLALGTATQNGLKNSYGPGYGFNYLKVRENRVLMGYAHFNQLQLRLYSTEGGAITQVGTLSSGNVTLSSTSKVQLVWMSDTNVAAFVTEGNDWYVQYINVNVDDSLSTQGTAIALVVTDSYAHVYSLAADYCVMVSPNTGSGNQPQIRVIVLNPYTYTTAVAQPIVNASITNAAGFTAWAPTWGFLKLENERFIIYNSSSTTSYELRTYDMNPDTYALTEVGALSIAKTSNDYAAPVLGKFSPTRLLFVSRNFATQTGTVRDINVDNTTGALSIGSNSATFDDVTDLGQLTRVFDGMALAHSTSLASAARYIKYNGTSIQKVSWPSYNGYLPNGGLTHAFAYTVDSVESEVFIGGSYSSTSIVGMQALYERDEPPPVNITVSATLPLAETKFIRNLDYHVASVALPLLDVAVTGAPGIAGEVEGTFAAMLIDLEDGLCRVNAVLPRATSTMTALAGRSAQIDASLPRTTGNISGYITGVAQISTSLPAVRAQTSATLGTIGSISVAARAPRFSVEALLGLVADISATLPSASLRTTAFLNNVAALSATLPVLRTEIDGDTLRTLVETLCVNLRTNALSHYESYGFNSFTEFNGMYLAGGSEGLYQVDMGDTDEGVQINADFSTGDLDFSSEYQKRLSDFYAGMRSDGDLILTVTADESVEREYTLGTYNVDHLKQRRVIVSKGAKGKYWRFAVRNTDGCDFEIDSMNVAAVPVARRI